MTIYIKTEQGQAALQNRSMTLIPRRRSTFILFDGKRTLQEVLAMTVGLGVTADDVAHLVEVGLLVAVGVVEPTSKPAVVAAARAVPERGLDGMPSQNSQDHYSKAYPIATRLTAKLGLRGFRLNLAVEAASDLAKLQQLGPKIREAVGPEKYLELERALFF